MNLNQRGLAGYQRGQIRWCAPVEAETSSAQLLVDFVCRTVFSVRTLSTRRFTIPCSLSFKLRRHLFFSFKKSKRKIFHTIIYNMFVRNRRNFWNSRVCVWITFEGTSKLHQFEIESSAIRRAVHVEKSRIMTKVRQYRFLPLLVHILLGGKFENIPFSSSHRSSWNVSFLFSFILVLNITK